MSENMDRDWEKECVSVEVAAGAVRDRLAAMCGEAYRSGPRELRDTVDDLAWAAARHAVDVAFGKASR